MQMYAQTEFNFEQPYIWVLKMKHNIQITEPAWGHDRFFLHLLCHNFDTKKTIIIPMKLFHSPLQ